MLLDRTRDEAKVAQYFASRNAYSSQPEILHTLNDVSEFTNKYFTTPRISRRFTAHST
jgi:hypothetical protein